MRITRSFFALLLCFLLCAASCPYIAEELSTPAFSEALVAASQDFDSYVIYATLDEDDKTLECVQTVEFTNRTGQLLEEIWFHVYPNAFQGADTTPVPQEGDFSQDFSPGGILFSSVQINGVEVEEATLHGEDLSRLFLSYTVAPGESLSIQLSYMVYFPEYAYRFGYYDGYFMIANTFSVLAVYADGEWQTGGYASVGDPFFSDCANYTLILTYPEGYQVAGTGVLQQQEAHEGQVTDTYEMLGVRDYGLLLRRGLHVARQMVGDTLLESYAQTETQAESALQDAVDAFTYLLSIFGDYDYPKLTIAQGALGQLGGMEYPAYVVINEAVYRRGRETELLHTIAHEIAHQWWYGLVGTDQSYDPWLDEGLAEYSAILVMGHLAGQEAMEAYIAESIEPAMRIDLPPGVVLSSPVWQFSTWSEYDRVIYKRAAGMLYGLHLALGDDAFFASLRTFLENNRFGIANRESFASAIEEVTGENWRGYLDDYLDSRE